MSAWVAACNLGCGPNGCARREERATVGRAAIAQLGERQTEDLKVPGSIPGLGTFEVSPSESAFLWSFDSASLRAHGARWRVGNGESNCG